MSCTTTASAPADSTSSVVRLPTSGGSGANMGLASMGFAEDDDDAGPLAPPVASGHTLTVLAGGEDGSLHACTVTPAPTC